MERLTAGLVRGDEVDGDVDLGVGAGGVDDHGLGRLEERVAADMEELGAFGPVLAAVVVQLPDLGDLAAGLDHRAVGPARTAGVSVVVAVAERGRKRVRSVAYRVTSAMKRALRASFQPSFLPSL